MIAFLLGTLLGILAGWRHGGWLDRSLPVLMFLQAAPYFFVALILVYFVRRWAAGCRRPRGSAPRT